MQEDNFNKKPNSNINAGSGNNRNNIEKKLIGSLIINRYKIVEKIASGGMSDVYLGMDTKLNRKAAIKILQENYAGNKNFVIKFKSEAQILARLNSPNIVTIYDWGEFKNLYFIAMEYVEGESLKDIINKKGALNPRTIANYSIQICNALEIAHNNNLIHRDIKSQNIIVTPEGKIKVTDFGIAKYLADDITKTINILGTAHYISPEQAQGKVLDWKTDIYSLGIVMYEMLTADVPFRGGSSIDISLRHMSEQPALPSKFIDSVPIKLEKIIMKCLEKNPARRYSNVTELKYDLQNYLDDKPLIIDGNLYNVKTKREFRITGKKVWLLFYYILSFCLIIIFLLLFIIYNNKYNSLNMEKNYTIVPPIENVNVESAKKILSTLNLYLIIKDEAFSSTVPEGNIIKQSPLPSTKIGIKNNIKVTISKGSENKLIIMPNITGLDIESGTKILKESGLDNIDISQIYSPDFEKNIIINQSPKFSVEIDQTAPISLVVSQGKKVITIPNVVGYDYLYGKNQIEILGLNVSISKSPDSNTEPGTILQVFPLPGSQVTENSTVEFIISTREQMVQVPDLFQFDILQAEDALKALNLGYEIRNITSDYGVQKGTVLGQVPEPGKYVSINAAITLFVGN
jgi:eukaryotic-like serine/threonine-protein kinase